MVFTNPALRALVLLVFCGSLFAVVPEGLGAAWAATHPDGLSRAWAQGMIMVAVPTGLVLGSLTVSRLVRPHWRRRLLRPLALATPLALVPALLNPPIVVAAGLALTSGFAIGALVPVANAEFVRALPTAYRARAFGVVSAGLQLLQGGAVLATGALALRMDLPIVVGLWSLAGVLLMIALIANWPSTQAFEEAGAKAAAMNAPTGLTRTRPATPAPAPAPAPASASASAPAARVEPEAKAALKESTPRRGLLAVIGAARRRTGPDGPGTIEQ